MKKIDWDKVWGKYRSHCLTKFGFVPTTVKKKIQSLVEVQLKPKRKRK